MNWWVITANFIAVNLDFFFILLLLLKQFKLRDVILGYLIGVLGISPILTGVRFGHFLEVLLFVGIFTVIIVCLLKLVDEIPVVNKKAN